MNTHITIAEVIGISVGTILLYAFITAYYDTYIKRTK
jgi:hypothetical protein